MSPWGLLSMTKAIVKRINFIEKEPFVLSYRKMLWIGGILVGVAVLFYGAQRTRVFVLEKKVTQLNSEVTKLKEERDRRLKELEGASGDPTASARSVLFRIFDDPLTWSVLLKELTLQIPNSLWLSSVKSHEKPDAPSQRGIGLDGQANGAEAVSHFVKSISESPYFEKVILTSSEQAKKSQGESYEFSIDLVLTSRKGRPRQSPTQQPPSQEPGKSGGKGT
jgi:Tfp pilus assembly protein PilN